MKEIKTIVRPITWLKGMVTGWGNGYVALPPGHKYHGVDYDSIPVDVHGGLTYANHWQEGKMPDGFEWPEDMKGYWIIGFDTAHFNDDPYNCSEEFVRAETERLADQMRLESWSNIEMI